MKNFILLLIIVICFADKTYSAEIMKSQYLYEPLFGIAYNPRNIHFDKAPDSIYLCPDLDKNHNILFVFGQITKGNNHYYILSGWQEDEPSENSKRRKFSAREDEGLIVVLSPKGCESASIGYLYGADQEVVKKFGMTESLTYDLTKDAIDRETKAFGGIWKLYKKIDRSINSPNYLPFSIIQKMATKGNGGVSPGHRTK